MAQIANTATIPTSYSHIGFLPFYTLRHFTHNCYLKKIPDQKIRNQLIRLFSMHIIHRHVVFSLFWPADSFCFLCKPLFNSTRPRLFVLYLTSSMSFLLSVMTAPFCTNSTHAALPLAFLCRHMKGQGFYEQSRAAKYNLMHTGISLTVVDLTEIQVIKGTTTFQSNALHKPRTWHNFINNVTPPLLQFSICERCVCGSSVARQHCTVHGLTTCGGQ